MTAPKGVQALTLAERRADARGIDVAMKRHVGNCPSCRGRNRCAEWQEMADQLRKARADIRTWFDPPSDHSQESLF